jgi:hypothetical protein
MLTNEIHLQCFLQILHKTDNMYIRDDFSASNSFLYFFQKIIKINSIVGGKKHKL